MSQLTIEWPDLPRGKRKLWIERLRLPPVRRLSNGAERLVKADNVNWLLRVIDQHARDKDSARLYLKTIAGGMNDKSHKTVERAIREAERRGLLAVERSFFRDRPSEYRIQWSAVAQAILDHPETSNLIDPFALAGAARRAAEMTPDILSVTPDILSVTPDILSVPADKMSGVNGSLTSSSRACAHARILKPSSNHVKPIHESMNGEIESPSESEDGQEGERRRAEQEQADWDALSEPGPYAGWPFKIQPVHLERPGFVWRFCDHATARGWVAIIERRRVFKLAFWALRLWRAGEIRSPGARFSAQLRESGKTGSWPGNGDDERAAAAALGQIQLGRRGSARNEASETDRLVARMIAKEAETASK